MLKIQLCIKAINYILEYVQIENSYLKLQIKFHNITVFFNNSILNKCSLVSIRDLF